MSLLVRSSRFVLSQARSFLAPPYSQLLIASDAAGWVLDEEAKEMIRIGGILGFPAYFAHRPRKKLKQCVHYTSLFSLTQPDIFDTKHRISVDYFHGKPDQDPAFRKVFIAMKANAHRLHRVRISYSHMRPLALEAGVEAERIHQISIGINPNYFSWQTTESKAQIRTRLGIPQSAVVIGSFQKDGQGWGDGMEPKHVKGPDVFLETIAQLKLKVPEVFVLLTGPARGFIKAGLERLGVPYKHSFFQNYSEIGTFYQALDTYIVASREEGGPKAILESMISGVPLITTNVGQAVDIAKHESNAIVVESGDSAGLAAGAERILSDSALRARLLSEGKITAAQHTYDAQIPLWRKFFADYVGRY